MATSSCLAMPWERIAGDATAAGARPLEGAVSDDAHWSRLAGRSWHADCRPDAGRLGLMGMNASCGNLSSAVCESTQAVGTLARPAQSKFAASRCIWTLFDDPAAPTVTLMIVISGILPSFLRIRQYDRASCSLSEYVRV